MSVPSVESMLVAGRAVFLVFSFIVAAVTFSRWRRAALAQTERLLAQHDLLLKRFSELESHLEGARAALAELGERLDRPRHVATPAGSASQGYEIAVRLARGGATREELISSCGLSQHEAELVWRLHAPRNALARLKTA
ncbi:MAG TPA: DUF2802 domain-containing protein [Steroidobacteraceae bacterium]|nr:DUF2802 domain-containing protein [Steroidobacteraceae bacterium]